jgi:hypothetical protein
MASSANNFQYAPVPQQEGGFPGGVRSMPLSDPDTESANIAASVLFVILGNTNPCKVETSSVYGPAIVMPQFARSTGYHRRVTELALRSLLFVVVNIVVQGWILYMFAKEQLVMDAYAGRMSLCDFGATLEDCPNANGCTGPGGTQYDPKMMFAFSQWTARNFVRDSLRSIFPDRSHDIDDQIRPGEYGVESTLCRLLCCFLFMMAVTKDAFQIYELWRLLWYVPNYGESWIKYENYPGLAEPEVHASRMLSLSQVKLRVAGMPLSWKIFNFCFIMLPKIVFWFMTADLGIAFLMNTSGITDSIVNSMALAFILSIDELIFETATAGRTKYMMDNTEPFHLHQLTVERCASEETVRSEDESHRRTWMIPDFYPRRLVFVVVLTCVFMAGYYYKRCEKSADGTWVSKPLHLPKSMQFSVFTAYFPFLFALDEEEDYVWSMPGS